MRIGFLMVLPLILVTLSCGGGSTNPPPNMNVVSASYAPPALPVYAQPVCPGPGYLWTPGYWAYDTHFNDYYWVPGTWVTAPQPGLLWTPPYWKWNGSAFVFNEGWWGPQVGFYGGVVYGFGYSGSGFQGGYWQGREFYYNQVVSNVNVTVVRNVFSTTVINNVNATRVSYNGGEGGLTARATTEEESHGRERYLTATAEQIQHGEAARTDIRFRASINHGKPSVAATTMPGVFTGKGVAKAAGSETVNHPTAAAPRPEAAQAPHAGQAHPGAHATAAPPRAAQRTQTSPSHVKPPVSAVTKANAPRRNVPGTENNLR